MDTVKFRGGARVGWVNASWPLASLTVDKNQLTLKCLGSYSLTPSEVVSIEPYGGMPFVTSGIRIRHNQMDYPETLIFRYLGNKQAILDAIERCGFASNGLPTARPSGIPIRWGAIILFLVVWNALFFVDQPLGHQSPATPGPFSVLALFLTFASPTALQLLPGTRRFVLNPGHQFGEIKAFLWLIQIVTGPLFVGFTIALVAARSAG